MKKLTALFVFSMLASAAFCRTDGTPSPLDNLALLDGAQTKISSAAEQNKNQSEEKKTFCEKFKKAVKKAFAPQHGGGKVTYANEWVKQCAESMFFSKAFIEFIPRQDYDYELRDCTIKTYTSIFSKNLKCMTIKIYGSATGGKTKLLNVDDHCDTFDKWWPEWGDYGNEINAKKSFDKPWGAD